ncbi:MAG: hypothetical protein JST79_13005 [Acidobacteria bacterium]|nr:hypothetical protein [Acidobacteriota bacterium]
MKVLATALLLAGLAWAQSSPQPASSSLPIDQENARQAKAVLDQMIQAVGGEAYLSVQDMSAEGRTYSFYHGRPNSYGVQFWRFYKYPDKDRYELTKQRDVLTIYNGEQGYEVTFKGVKSLEAKDLKDYQRRRDHSLDWVLRKWLKGPGMALFYEGQTVAEGKPVQQVTIMDARNEAVTLYVDTETHLPVKKSYSWRDATDQQRNVEDEVYDNYKLVQGIWTAHTVTRYYNGDMSNQRFMSTVTYNQNLSDSLFDPANATKRK